jgi:phosphatidylserine/phosphatidylglycerophosphate/cardiolipin synthase-like enzyme
MIATPALLALPARDLETLAAALRSSRLGPNSGGVDLQAFFGQVWVAQIAADLRAMAAVGFSGTQMACVIALLAQARTADVNSGGAVELVTTGPLPSSEGDTRVVVQQLFYEAKHSILIAGYEFYNSEPVFRALANRMAAEPGLQVRFCVNLSHVKTGGEAAAVKEFLSAFQRFHWPEHCRLPAFYYDPRTIVPPPALQHRLHAKCVVVDGEQAFISSANFTEAAHERNIEVGVLVRSPASAARLVEFFEQLIHSGHLVPISI